MHSHLRNSNGERKKKNTERAPIVLPLYLSICSEPAGTDVAAPLHAHVTLCLTAWPPDISLLPTGAFGRVVSPVILRITFSSGLVFPECSERIVLAPPPYSSFLPCLLYLILAFPATAHMINQDQTQTMVKFSSQYQSITLKIFHE